MHNARFTLQGSKEKDLKHLLSISLVALLALAFTARDAEARRFGGGRSLGAQRSIVAPSRNVQQAPPSTGASAGSAAAPQPAGKRWLGPIAGLAAGLGLGWLIGQGGMMGTLLMMALIGFAVIAVLRLFTRPRTENNMRYAAEGNDAAAPPSLASGLAAAPALDAHPRANIPAGFDTDGFLRQAKLQFVKLQAVHDSGRLDEVREFTTDEMYASIKQDMEQHRIGGQRTDVVTLAADLLEAITEGDTHWASVRFSGMIREDPDARPEPFQEVWNLAKPVSGASGWVLAGIQQVQ